VSNRRAPNHIVFGNTVHVQTPVNKLVASSAIVFEFKHYKPKKKKAGHAGPAAWWPPLAHFAASTKCLFSE
jgi:hypothetical protein